MPNRKDLHGLLQGLNSIAIELSREVTPRISRRVNQSSSLRKEIFNVQKNVGGLSNLFSSFLPSTNPEDAFTIQNFGEGSQHNPSSSSRRSSKSIADTVYAELKPNPKHSSTYYSADSTTLHRPPPSSEENLRSTSFTTQKKRQPTVELPSSTVPSSPLARAFQFGILGSQIVSNEIVNRLTLPFAATTEHNNKDEPPALNTNSQNSTLTNSKKSSLLSESGLQILASGLCRMRGAALKLGQIISMQDSSSVPPQVLKAFEQVRTNAAVMPVNQLRSTLAYEFQDTDWQNRLFVEFQEQPIAAASIGQVHLGFIEGTALETGQETTLETTGQETTEQETTGQERSKDGPTTLPVAVKVQYPGVAQSIDSDISNLRRLASTFNVFPKGLFIDNALKSIREELKVECDYIREAKFQKRYYEKVRDLHDKGLDVGLIVPQVIEQCSTEHVLTTTYFNGIPLDEVSHLPSEVRNRVARRLLWLSMQELFDWRFMQTDPNWGNYLYNIEDDEVGLIDFGAVKEFSEDFVEKYFTLVWSAATKNKELLLKASKDLGFLTGRESLQMIDAHCQAGMIIGEPFATNDVYRFTEANFSQRIAKYGAVFMSHRLTPPPQEIYALHRALSGAYLTCVKLGAEIKCRDVLQEMRERKFSHLEL
eukprot:g1205.t1